MPENSQSAGKTAASITKNGPAWAKGKKAEVPQQTSLIRQPRSATPPP